jgi:hypothetical protein
MKDDNKLIDIAAHKAIDLAPKPEMQPVDVPPQMILAMVHAGVLSKRQGFDWLFKYIEPTEFDYRKENR